MNLETINQESNDLWFGDDGNNTHALNYPLNENSTVVDLGGYHGKWATSIIDKYNPYMVLVEPIPQFYELLKSKFANNPKVTVLNYGVSSENTNGFLFLNGDGTSMHLERGNKIPVEFITIELLLDKIGKKQVELIQINIEGEEFNLLDNMMKTGLVRRFNNLQIQFHTYIDDAINKRSNIQHMFVENGFEKLYDYPFVFEGWSLRN
jgi:FkbM family methyltransferase